MSLLSSVLRISCFCLEYFGGSWTLADVTLRSGTLVWTFSHHFLTVYRPNYHWSCCCHTHVNTAGLQHQSRRYFSSVFTHEAAEIQNVYSGPNATGVQLPAFIMNESKQTGQNTQKQISAWACSLLADSGVSRTGASSPAFVRLAGKVKCCRRRQDALTPGRLTGGKPLEVSQLFTSSFPGARSCCRRRCRRASSGFSFPFF